MIPIEVLSDEEFKDFLRKFMSKSSQEIFTQFTNLDDDS
jgi:hypothetical protein